ncbi:Repetin [Streptomyces sp. NPDC050355]|uniref:Repetin n=1 Tax=Streptomyces sp. NPDC050355 TaxID=3365609 RepID=UPI00379E7768
MSPVLPRRNAAVSPARPDSFPGRRSRRRIAIAATGALALLSAVAVGSAAADAAGGAPAARPGQADSRAAEGPSLTGSGKLYRSAGDNIHFSFDARFRADQGPLDARGTFRLSHVFPNGTSGFAEGRIDCLITGGKIATASGIVTRTDRPGLKGKRVGFSVSDHGRHDRLGYSWATDDPAKTKDLPPCAASAPFEILESGDFTVVPWRVRH